MLDRLCAPLCDALLAADLDTAYASPPAISSQQLLEELEAANLFLVPLDDDRRWYRYHHLFADALRGRLAREAGPDAAALLHRQASIWFGRQGLLPEAIGHALAADAVEDAATWIEALMPSMFATMGIHQALADWLNALPQPVVRSRPLLCLAQAWLLIHRVELEAAAAWVEAAAQALPAMQNFPGHNDAARQAHGAVAATRAYLFVALLNRLISHFPSGEMVFNSYTPFAIWAVHHSPGTKEVADLIKFPDLMTRASRKAGTPN